MENLVPIGQFAAASRLSPKALRLYDENGLLPPACVDPESGYRYYRLQQLEQATTIRLLRRAGIPLGEIRAFLADPSMARLEEYERSLLERARRPAAGSPLPTTPTEGGDDVQGRGEARRRAVVRQQERAGARA